MNAQESVTVSISVFNGQKAVTGVKVQLISGVYLRLRIRNALIEFGLQENFLEPGMVVDNTPRN